MYKHLFLTAVLILVASLCFAEDVAKEKKQTEEGKCLNEYFTLVEDMEQVSSSSAETIRSVMASGRYSACELMDYLDKIYFLSEGSKPTPTTKDIDWDCFERCNAHAMRCMSGCQYIENEAARKLCERRCLRAARCDERCKK